jgi:hypothetical protein
MHESGGRTLLLPLAKLRLDGDTHGRARLSAEVIHDYAEELGRGVEFPPVVAFHDGEHYFLADGFLRWHAHQRAGRSHINVDVRPGGVRDARMYAASANAAHGVRRSYEDRRRAVLLVLEDEEGRRWSAAQIAKHCAVSEPFVQALKLSWRSLKAEDREDLLDHSARSFVGEEDDDDEERDREVWRKQLWRTLNRLHRLVKLLDMTPEDALTAWRDGSLKKPLPPAEASPAGQPAAQPTDLARGAESR